MTNKEKDEILTTIAQIPLSDPTMDSTRYLILLYLSEKLGDVGRQKND
jgi:hypothetical protein